MFKKKKIDSTSKIGGLLFLVTIAAVFIVGIIVFLANILIITHADFNFQNLINSGIGFVLGLVLFSGEGFIRLRTFIHESKHAIVVILTGNKLKGFKAENGSGHVSFLLYKDRLGFAPVITLAPYYFPLCSLPIFLLALFGVGVRPILFSFGIGLAVAIDIMSGIAEIHPQQTDLRRIVGGFLVAGSFIGGFILTWVNICLLWILSGSSGFAVAIEIAAILIEKIIYLK